MLAALWLSPSRAHAQFETEDFSVGPEVEVTLLHGYPRSARNFYGPMTFGLVLKNRGGARELRLDIDGYAEATRTLRLQAGEERRVFTYLPARSGYTDSYVELVLSDLRTGKRKAVSARSSMPSEAPVARLGPVSTAMNVEQPWTLVGALNSAMPDDWRGISGLALIVMEHGYAQHEKPNWNVLLPWVVNGGVLVLPTKAEDFDEPAPWLAAGNAQTFPSVPWASEVAESTQAGLIQHVGLGAIARVLPEHVARIDADFVQLIGLCESCVLRVDARQLEPDAVASVARNRLSGAVKRPGALLLLLLSAFALIVGPLGWLVFVRKHGRPLRYVGFSLGVAVGFCAFVVVLDLFQNGVHTRSVANSIVYVDQRAGVELGVEDLALYVPAGRAPTLSASPSAQLLLPMYVMPREQAHLRVVQTHERQTLEGAVPERKRTLVGSRWYEKARGRLVVQEDAHGIVVENHLGRDLKSLTVWRAGKEYALGALAQGARAEASARTDTANLAPVTANGPMLDALAPLLSQIVNGARGGDRFVGTFEWTRAGSQLVQDDVRPYKPGKHVIAGVL